jgi:hypothetical protein
MRAIAVIGIGAVASALFLSLSIPTAWSQSLNDRSRCLSIANIDSRVDCLENGGESTPAQGTAQYGMPKPSFDCAKATYADEYAICSNAELSQLDNVANAGYEYVRRVYGTQYSKSATLPLLHARQACGSNIVCIKQQQLAAIQIFQSLGAPISGPQVAQPEQLLWGHNGSTVYLVAKGSSRTFFYKEPKPEIELARFV